MIGIFLDIESNGLNPRVHKPIEVALKLVELESQNEVAAYESVIQVDPSDWELSDPNSLEVNGFTYEMTKPGKTEEVVQKEIIDLFNSHHIHRDQAVYICQNPSFDRSYFSLLISPELQEKNSWPYHWLDLASMFWALQLEKQKIHGAKAPWETGISKNKIARALGLDEEANPHRAMNGVNHLIECYFALNTCHQA